jgi:prevent-host-death family protein
MGLPAAGPGDDSHDHGQEIAMRTIKASDFKATCLKLMDEVAATGEPVVITKNRRPVAQLGPIGRERKSIWGLHPGAGRDPGGHHRAPRRRMGG